MYDLIRACHHTERELGVGSQYKPLTWGRVMCKGKGVIAAWGGEKGRR